MNFEDYHFMQLGGNCAWLAMLPRDKRPRGPMDNTILCGVNGIKLLIENKFYSFIKNTPYESKLRQQGFFKGDCEYLSIFPNNTVRFVHNIPNGEKFFNNLKIRCENFKLFYDKVKTDPKYYFIITLNQDMIEYKTGNIKNNNKLINIIKYLKNIKLFNKVIFIGSRVKTIKYDAFDYYLNNVSYNNIKKLFPDIQYIEITDVNVWDQQHAENEFKEKVVKLLSNLEKNKIKNKNTKKNTNIDNSYLGYSSWGI